MQVQTSYKDIWKIASPVIVGSIAMTIINITDTAFLGRVGETELGASAIGGVLYFAFAMIGLSIGTGAQIMIARRSGERKDESIGEIVDHSIYILFAISAFLFLVLRYLTPLVLPRILNSERLVEATIQFLDYRSFGIFALMLGTVFRSFYVGIARPNIYAVYSFIMAALNFVLGYAFIFGHFGISKMGITGAGLASSIAESCGLIFLVFYTVIRKDVKHFQLFRFKSFQKELNKKIILLSAPLVVQNLLSMGSWFIFFVFIEKLGEHELAMSNIVRGAYMISMTPIWGFSIAANSMISNVIGQDRKTDVMPLLNKVLQLTLGVALIMILVNVLFPIQLLRIFTNDMQLINDSMGSLAVVDFSMLFFSFALVAISAVSGTGATQVALKIEVVAILVYLVYNYFVTFVLKGPIELLWCSEIIYWSLTGFASYYYVKSMKWKNILV